MPDGPDGCYNGDHSFTETGVVCLDCGFRIYPRCWECGRFVTIDRDYCTECIKREDYEIARAAIDG